MHPSGKTRALPGKSSQGLRALALIALGFLAGYAFTTVHTSFNSRIQNRIYAATQDAQPKFDQCFIDPNNEFHGAVVLPAGPDNLQDSAEGCCKVCQETKNCNAWVWCSTPTGCGGDPHNFKHCWMKMGDLQTIYESNLGKGHAGISWTAGAVFTREEYEAVVQLTKAKQLVDAARRAKLREDPELPLVYMDVAIDGGITAGRIEMVLFVKDAPLAAENLRQLCTGEAGTAPAGSDGAGKPYTLKGAYFNRILYGMVDETGAATGSIYGTNFIDEHGALAMKHDRKGLLSLENSGPDSNGSKFAITLGPQPQRDGHYGIFGEVVSGLDVVDAINALSKGQDRSQLLDSKRAQIVDVGQIRRGSYIVKKLDPKTGQPKR